MSISKLHVKSSIRYGECEAGKYDKRSTTTSNQSDKRKTKQNRFIIRTSHKNRITPAVLPLRMETTPATASAEAGLEKSTALLANILPTSTTTILLRTDSNTPVNASRLSGSIRQRTCSTLSLKSANKQPATQTNQIYIGGDLEQKCNINLPNLCAVRGGEVIKPLRKRPPSRRHMVQSKCPRPAICAKSFTSIRPATANTISHLKPTASTTNSLNNSSASNSNELSGICCIARHPKEQELLPDRINCDKRGLTMIPLIENEPNLRVLSLQHNLINIFHIPKEALPSDNPKNPPNSETPIPDKHALRCQNFAQLTHTEAIPSLIITTPCSDFSPPQKHFNNNKSPCNQPKMKPLSKYQVMTKSMLPNHIRLGLSKSKCLLNKFTNLTLSNSNSQANRKTKFPTAAMDGKSFDSSVSGLTTDSASTFLSSETDGLSNTSQVTYSSTFKHLVFLDLYDNQIERIENLDGLPALTVLLLGKNRISDISGLACLRSTLTVLDLHGNKISSISNKINSLQNLRSLNLASNQLKQINQNDFNGLKNLKELNLKRNRLKRIHGFEHLPALERLWLCHNDLQRVDDMATIVKANKLIELTIENNPVSLAGDCVSFLVSYLPNLRTLSRMPITDKVRIAAMNWYSNKQLTIANANAKHLTAENYSNLRREEIISNARTNWELLRSQQQLKFTDGHDGRHQQFTTDAKAIKLPLIDVEADNLQQIIYNQNAIGKVNHINRNRNGECQLFSSNSSLGPNINSSSTCYSSADDEYLPPATGATTKGKCLQPAVNRPSKAKSTKKSRKLGSSSSSSHCNSDNKPTNPVFINSNQPTKLTDDKGDKAATINEAADLNSGIEHNIRTTILTATDSTASVASKSLDNNIIGKQMALQMLASDNNNNNNNDNKLMNSSRTMDDDYKSAGDAKAITESTFDLLQMSRPATQLDTKQLQKHKQIGAQGDTQQPTLADIFITNSNQSSTCQGDNKIVPCVPGDGVNDANETNCKPAKNSAAIIYNQEAKKCDEQQDQQRTEDERKSKDCELEREQERERERTRELERERHREKERAKEREQGGDYLIEICGRYLNIYGQGAIRFIDKQWNPSKANDVHTLNFSYMNFNNITAVFDRIKSRFPHAVNYVFRETNITYLGQLNALAELQGINSLYIDPEGNTITTKDLWRPYAIYRLSHWGLKLLNQIEVTAGEIDEANRIFAGLSELVMWSIPESMLEPLLQRLNLEESCIASKLSPKEWLMREENKSLRLVVGKEALQWNKTSQQEVDYLTSKRLFQQTAIAGNHLNKAIASSSELATAEILANESAVTNVAAAPMCFSLRERGRQHISQIMQNTCDAIEKLHKLDSIWPSMLSDIIRNTLIDYSQFDAYIHNFMNELMK